MYLNRSSKYNWQLEKAYDSIRGATLFHLDGSELKRISLNSTAAAIWLLCDGSNKADELKRIAPQAEPFIQILLKKELLTEDGDFSKCTFEERMKKDITAGGSPSLKFLKSVPVNELMRWEDDFRKYFDKNASWSQLYRPLKVNIDITSGCNLRCRHCYYYRDKDIEVKRLDINHIKLIVNKMSDAGVSMINLFGGEPFERSDILQILDYIRSKKMKISVNTNGLLLDDKDIDYIGSNDISLILSFDGYNNKTHDFLRGDGAYDKVVKVIQKIKSRKIPLTVYHTLHRRNYYSLPRFVLHARKLLIDTIGIIPLLKDGRSKDNGSLTPPGDLKHRIMSWGIKIYNWMGLKPFIYNSSCDAYLYTHCGVDGEMNYCQLSPSELNIGNILDKDLLEIWHSDQYQDFFDLTKIEKCQACPLRFGCKRMYSCRLMDYVKNRDFFQGPDKCRKGRIAKIFYFMK